MVIFYLILVISVLINLLVLFIDTIPFLWPKLKRKVVKRKQIKFLNNDLLEKKIVTKAFDMAKSKKNKTIWNESVGFTETIFKLIVQRKLKQSKLYNYPRAYLFYGISEYLKINKDKNRLEEFKKIFDELIHVNGESKFELNKVDQAPFGLAALNLFFIYKENKYKAFADKIYDRVILENINELNLIDYRKGFDIILCDTLGMIVPFLVEYYNITSNSNALDIASSQLKYYIKNGIDKETFIPVHGVEYKSNIKGGSINWGRGIGWYLLAISKLYELTGSYENEFKAIFNSLNKVTTKENLYSQFPGSTFMFDASTSTMFYYAFSFLENNNYSKKYILDLFSKYIDNHGYIRETSGDTYWLNNYSKSFGKSELSQGMLLLLLSKTE